MGRLLHVDDLMGISGRGARALIAASVVAFGAPVLALSPATPAGAVGTGIDCNGADTPPSHTLASGATCEGSLDEPHSSTTSDLNGNTVFHYADLYDFDYTDADRVQVTFSGTSCMSVDPSGTFVASGTGNAPLDVKARRNATPAGAPLQPCPDQPGDYSVRVTVTPNDRPAVNPTSVPTSANQGETVTFEVAGTDPDGDLRSLGIRYGGPSQSIQWKSQLLPSASWSTTFEQQVFHDLTVTFFAQDSRGAVSPASATYFVQLIQNDCDLGEDAVVEPVTLPFHCDGWSAGDSDMDSFTFTLPADRRARVRTLVGFLQGFTIRLTSPSGVVTASNDIDVISAAEAGTWRLDMTSDGDTQAYTLDVREIGLPAPPVLVLSHSAITHQGDLFPLPMTGFDPNDETLRYRVEWSDGAAANYPVDDSRAVSGATVTAERRFWLTTPTSISGTVTVTNVEGLSDSETFSVSIQLHNDCGFGTPAYDAPDAGSLRTMPGSGVCNGTVGHSLFNPPWSVDAEDHYRSSHSCPLIEACKLRATITTAPGLAATVTIDNNVQRAAASCGFGGCTTSVELAGPSFPSGNHPQVWVRADGGQGAYSVKIEKVSLLADPL